MPTATQLASVWAGTFNPAQTSAKPLTLSTLHGLTRRSHAEGAGGAWLLAPLGRPWAERCSRQVTCSGPGHRRVRAGDCAPAGRAPRQAGHEGGRLRTVAFPPGGTCRGRPRAPSCPTHRGPGSAAARRGVPGAAWASESRPLPPRRVQKDARRPALPRRWSDWKGERTAREPGSTGSLSAAGTDPGRGARGCGYPRRPQGRGHGTRGIPGERVDSVSGSAGFQVMQVAVVPGSVGRNPVGCSVANPCLTFPGLVKGATWGKSHQRDTSQINPGGDLLLQRDLLMKID